MKRILNFLAQVFLVGSVTFSTIACHNLLSSRTDVENKSPAPIVKNITYYQEKIKETQSYIDDCNGMLKEVQKNKKDYENERDYQSALDEITAEKFCYQSEIYQYQYQILVLEKGDKEFSSNQVLQGIVIFSKKIANLEQELKLKEKYSKYFSKLELQEIKNKIVVAKKILAMFNELKEENDARSN